MGSRVREDGSGDSPRREGGLCAEGPASAGSLSAWKNLPERKRPPAQARLPAQGHSFGRV